MAFQFIHTGDWHLAKSFGRFDAEIAPLLRDARMRIVDRVGTLARQTGSNSVLVAGDVFDGPLVGDDVLRKLAARLGHFADLSWHFLPGNHDPSVANGIWQRFARLVDGDHIVVHHEAGLTHLATDVDLLTAPLRARAIAHDPTAWMMDRDRTVGTIRIGLAHGAVQGFGSAGEASVLISPDRAVSADLDYLALGDWHGVRQVGPKAWYAGTPEPEQFPDNEPGYALSVQISGPGTEPVVERHWLAQYRWQREVLSGDVLANLEGVERRVADAGSDAADLLLRLDLRGRATLDGEFELRDRIERLKDQIFYLEADFSQLNVDSRELDPGMFGEPLLATVGARLAAQAAAEGPDAVIAHEALLMLAGLCRAAEDSA
ncbi:MAG: metallophosphoesterase [Hyphomicrobiaceae bacterium]